LAQKPSTRIWHGYASEWPTDVSGDFAGKSHPRIPESARQGFVKVMSKMGISTYMSYCGAQVFEAIGLISRLSDNISKALHPILKVSASVE